MRKSAAIALLLTVLVLAAWKLLPFMAAAAPAVDSTPVPPPLSAIGKLKVSAGSTLCTDEITYTPDSRFVQLIALKPPARMPPLSVVARAPGYGDAQSVAAREAGTFAVPLRPPGSERPPGTLCLTNNGSRTAVLAGLPRLPAKSLIRPTRSISEIDGKPLAKTLSITLLRSQSSSRLSNLSGSVANAATLRPLAPAAVWLVILLLVLGVPVALAVALAISAGRSEEEEPLTVLGRAPDPPASKPEER